MAHYITIIANIFHIYAVYQFSQLLFQKKPNRKLLEFILYFLYFQINSFCFVYFHSIIWNVLSNLIPFFCITLFYPTTWSHRILSVFSLYDHLIGLMKKQHTVHLIEQQNKTYQEQIKAVQQSQMRLRFLRHDIKNHLFQMQHYLDTNDIDGLRSYISDTEYHLDLARSTTYTQHEQINSILNYKLMPLQLDDTNLDIDIRLPEELPYAPFDLTVLLGNLLDNAAEATEKVFPKEQRHIILKMRVKFGALQLNIRNRYDNILPDESGTRKPDKKRHGLGMKSVQDIVDRYHGKIWTVPEKDWYEVNVILYQPEHSISSES